MQQSILKFVLGIVLLFMVSVVSAQTTQSIKPNQKDVGIPITKKEFDDKVSNYLVLMSKWTLFKADEYVDMVRLYNTIGGAFPIDYDFYKQYYTVFLIMYSKLAATSLQASLTKGMSMYSKKYDLWIGDVPLGNNNSRFKIDTLR